MAVTPDRLVNVLEQYRDKLHQAGDSAHEEELDYIREILASPIFNQYLNGTPPSHENSTIIAEATNDLITGIQDGKESSSPSDRRKTHLQRKQSLKTLRNAVTPKNSPLIVTKRSTRVESSNVTTSGLTQVSKLALAPSHDRNSRTEPPNELEPNQMPKVGSIRQTSLTNCSSDDSIVASILKDIPLGNSLNHRIKNLSNSTSTLIDKSISNGGPVLRKKSSDSHLRPGSGGSLTGSQPNISTLNSIPLAINSGGSLAGTHPEPIGSAVDMAQVARPGELITGAVGLTHDSGGKLMLSPETRPPPPSYHAHMQKQLQHSQEPLADTSRPLIPHRKAKSLDKQLEVTMSPLNASHLHNHHQPPALTPLAHPMTNGSVTKDVPTTEKRKTTFTIRLDKGAEGLGFMVKAVKNETKGEVGLSIQDIQPGGLAERDGRLRRNDQISHINGHPLTTLPHSDAVSLLQSSRGPVELVIVREHPSQAPPPSPPTHRYASHAPPHSPPSLRHPLSTSPVRHHMSSHSSAPHCFSSMKKQPGTQSPPSRPHTPTPNNRLRPLEESTSQGSGSQQQRIVTIELPNDGRRGFGFSVISQEGSDRTVVHSVVAGGIAEQDGRLQKNDQLLQINEESVLHMEHDDIIAKLRTVSQAGRPIRLVIARTVTMETSTGEVPDLNDSSDDELDEFEVELHRGNNKGLGITIAGLVNTDTGVNQTNCTTTEEVKGIYITSLNPNGAAALDNRINVGDRILRVDGHPLKGLENMEAASVLRNSGNPVRLVLSRKKDRSTDNQVKSKGKGEDPPQRWAASAEEVADRWTSILGPEYIIKVDEVTKMEGGGLGIRMESTAELDEEGEPHTGSVHHVIQYIHPEGPIGRHNILQVGDELLEINGNVLVGLSHSDAIEVVRHTPSDVQVVVCQVEDDRRQREGEDSNTSKPEELDGTYSGEDNLLSNTNTFLALPSIDLSGLGDNFSRRFERKSWRERHEQQKKIIKQRFEQKREEFLRHLQEQDDELVQQEAELKERQRQAEEEERRKSDEDHNRDSSLLPFDYTAYRSSSQMSGLEEPLHSPDSILDSDSSLLSPVPGSTIWEDEPSEVVLLKGRQGLGFSILDFADPLQSDGKVILVHSLVEGGAAERDGGLRVGDKLVSVNHISMLNHPLDFAVQQLVSVPLGGSVSIEVYHPLSGGLEIGLCSPYSPEEEEVTPRPFEGTRVIQDDEDQKPLSEHEEEPGGVITEADLEGQDNPEEEGDEKKKKPDTDDDEPPPPYSKDDPQEEKPNNTPQGDEHPPEAADLQQPKLDSGDIHVPSELSIPPSHSETETNEETHSTDDIDSPHTNTPSPLSPVSPKSPAQLSWRTNPEKGRSLSDLTRIKPEDLNRLHQDKEVLPQPLDIPTRSTSAQSKHDSVNEFSLESLSSSDNTLVNSQSLPSQSELGQESTSSTLTSGSLTQDCNSTPVYVSSPSSDRDLKSAKVAKSSNTRKTKSKEKLTKRTKGKRIINRGHKTTDSYPNTPTRGSLAVNYGSPQGMLGSSQESSGFDGLSPELSDPGETSCDQADAEPREIRIRKIGTGYGITLAFDQKSNCIVVKSLSSSGAVGRDGRIRVGDRITAIDGKSLSGVNLSKAKGFLKRASARSEELVIVYTPAPQVHGYVMPPGTNQFVNSPGTRSSITEAVIPAPPSSYYPQGMQGVGGNMQIHPVMAPGPGYPRGMMQNLSQPSPWHIDGSPAYHPHPPGMNVQGGYFPQYEEQLPNQMSKHPPPPYVFPHQPGPSPAQPMISQAPPHSYPNQPQSWSMSTGGSNVHMLQHSPNMGGNQWGGLSRAPMTSGQVHRDPPQYNDLHMMAMQQSTPQSQQGPLTLGGNGTMTPQQQYIRQPAAHFSQEHPSHLNQSSQPVVSPRQMNKSQSESKFHSGMTQRPNMERRHNSHGGASHTPQRLFKNSKTRSKQKMTEGVFEDRQRGRRTKASKDEPMGPLPTHMASRKEGKKDTPAKYSRTQTLQESPDHSHHNSWAIEEEEDPLIRAEFPDAEGHLFEVTLQKGKAGLGLSIVTNSTPQSIRGIVIMGVQQGGVAEKSGRVKWGDMILKVNDTCVIGMSQQEVQGLLAKAPPTVRFVLLRQHMMDRTQQQKGKHTQGDSDISLDGLAQVKAVTLYADDKKSLGFNIEKGEVVGGAPTVLVANLTPGGPAELSNSLQVGDQILSVDGQKILGYAYEKARVLLQQARQRGQVTIVVASHSPTTHKEGEGRGVEQDKTQPHNDVVLRPNRRKSSLRPSKRRPVSVDYDRNTGSPNLHKTDGVPVDNNRTSYYSNRSSHPLTEREVEQGFQYFEQKNKDITPLKECEIIIFMGPHDLGLVLTGGVDSQLPGIYIQHIVPDSPADRDGRLKAGDQIKMINNTVMEGLTRDEAIQTLKSSPAFVHLNVLREAGQSASSMSMNEDTTPSFSPPDHSASIELINLVKPPHGSLGLVICEHEDHPQSGVFVQNVVSGKAAYIDGRINPGDKILAINGQDVSTARQDYVVHLLQNCGNKVSLKVLHHPHTFTPSRPPHNQLDYGRSGDLEMSSSDPTLFQTLHPPPEYPYGSTGRQPTSHDRILPPYARVADSAPAANEYMHHQYSGYRAVGVSNGDTDIDMPVSSPENSFNIHIIHLHRGPSGLGFSIVGGKGSKHGDLPIYVKSMFEEGAAGKDGHLKRGDQILSVNGYSFENVTHEHAVETLKLLKGDIELTIFRTE